MLDREYDPAEVRRFESGLAPARGLRNGIIGGIAAWAVIGLFACQALAQTATGTGMSMSGAQADSGAMSQSTANPTQDARTQAGASAGVQQNYYSSGESRQDQRVRSTIRNTPNLATPGLFGGTNPCTVGGSLGVTLPGFGIGGGLQFSDPGCERRNLAAVAFNIGQVDLANEVLCGADDVRQARARLGRPCLVDVQRAQAQQAQPGVPAALQPSAPVVVPAGPHGAPVTVIQPAPARGRPAFCDTLSNAQERARYRSACAP